MPSFTNTVTDIYRKNGPISAAFGAVRYSLGWASYKAREINKKIHKQIRDNDGIDVIKEDWDTLIILDACRYDAFEDSIAFDGTLESRISKGGQSLEFLNKNFNNGSYPDTIYISANAYTGKIDTNFFKLVNVWDFGWNSEYQTVLPDTVTQAAIDAYKEHPDKRLIVHYMQPHMPFIGEEGMKLRRKYNISHPDRDDSHSLDPSLHYGLSDITIDEAWEGYMENLSVVLDSVEELIDEVDGKSVITADHGELFGEWIGPIPTPMYGHTPRIRNEHLIKVPWFILDYDRRRIIKEQETKENTHSESKIINDRLRDLGYI